MTHVLAPREGTAAEPGAQGREAATDLSPLRADLEELRDFRLQQLTELDADLEREHGTALRNVTASLKVAALVALREIDAALERIAADDGYGLCQHCGDRIPAGRLKVLPMATLCMPCQAGREQQCR